MYFTAEDRIKNSNLQAVTPASEDADADTQAEQDPEYYSRTVNPEYIARYNNASEEAQAEGESEEAPEYYKEEAQARGDAAAYVTPFNTQVDPYASSLASNRWWRNRNYYGGGFYDPFFDPFWDPYASARFYDPFYNPYAWNAWGRPRVRVRVSYGWGWNSWNSWGWGRPAGYWDPWYGNGWNAGWNSWNRWNDPFWCPPS
ncbi:MAG TPA: hypothetical protein DCR93_23675 [Cytophagales bacterium]|nr:hypothetical protein [Cytophagales bacterium]